MSREAWARWRRMNHLTIHERQPPAVMIVDATCTACSTSVPSTVARRASMFAGVNGDDQDEVAG